MKEFKAKKDCYVILKAKEITTFKCSYFNIKGNYLKTPLPKGCVITSDVDFEVYEELNYNEGKIW